MAGGGVVQDDEVRPASQANLPPREESIDAHLTVVFAALAIGRHLQELTELLLKRLITDLKSVRSAKILVNGQEVTFTAQIPDVLYEVLSRFRGRY